MSAAAANIEARVVEFLRIRGMLDAGTREHAGSHFLIAASGGRDSTVLVHVMAHVAAAWHARLTLATVQHGLREEAEQEVAFVESLARKLGLGFLLRRVDVRAEMLRVGSTLQDAARRLRYRALEEMCDEAGASVILTAHHADDQAETLLAHFLRGAGPDGLAGIRPVLGRVARPLLAVSAGDIGTCAGEWDLEWMEDASNSRDDYRRNAIRHHVSPAVTGVFGPGWVRALGESARLHVLLADFLESRERTLATEALVGEGEDLLVREISLNDSSEFEKLIVCRHALRGIREADPSLDECLTLLRLFEEQTGAMRQFAGGVTAIRERGALRLLPAAERQTAVDVSLGGNARWGAWTLASDELPPVRPALTDDPFEEVIDLDAAGTSWRLREWTTGDRFEARGFGREKAVGAFLADSGYALPQRRRIPVLEGPQGIIWVCGVRLAEHAALHTGSRRFGRLHFFITNDSEE